MFLLSVLWFKVRESQQPNLLTHRTRDRAKFEKSCVFTFIGAMATNLARLQLNVRRTHLWIYLTYQSRDRMIFNKNWTSTSTRPMTTKLGMAMNTCFSKNAICPLSHSHKTQLKIPNIEINIYENMFVILLLLDHYYYLLLCIIQFCSFMIDYHLKKVEKIKMSWRREPFCFFYKTFTLWIKFSYQNFEIKMTSEHS